MSAIDLFASALGAFILISIILMPYYLKKTRINDIDLVFVMDTTSSMGKQLEDLNDNLFGLFNVLKKVSPSLHIGFVAFRDKGKKDQYLTKTFELKEMTDSNLSDLTKFVKNLEPHGGGDFPEAILEGLTKAIDMPWRSQKSDVIKIIVLIGDAPPHESSINKIKIIASSFHNRVGKWKISAIATHAKTEKKPASITLRSFRKIVTNGGGELVVEKGRIMESILISALAKN